MISVNGDLDFKNNIGILNLAPAIQNGQPIVFEQFNTILLTKADLVDGVITNNQIPIINHDSLANLNIGDYKHLTAAKEEMLDILLTNAESLTTSILAAETLVIDDVSAAKIEVTWNVSIASATSYKRLTITVTVDSYMIYAVSGSWNLNCLITANLINDKISLIATNNTAETLTITSVLVSSF